MGKSKTLIEVRPPNAGKGALRAIGGSNSDDWNTVLGSQAALSMWPGLEPGDGELVTKCQAIIDALGGIAPRDELDAMAAAQLIAAHNASMECYRRAMIPEQSDESRKVSLDQAAKLSRTWAILLDALNKHRGKGQQKVTVEHVHVHPGGQAVVGAVQAGPTTPREGEPSLEGEQRYARPLTHAPEPSMWRENAERDPVPIPRDEERPLPHARR